MIIAINMCFVFIWLFYTMDEVFLFISNNLSKILWNLPADNCVGIIWNLFISGKMFFNNLKHFPMACFVRM